MHRYPTLALRLQRVLLFAGLLLIALCFAPLAGRAAAAERPNIIFFLVDDQRNDILGCAGHPILKTPVIDSLAERGVRFENAFVTTSICAASRATLFTGLYERTHRFTFGTPPIQAQFVEQSYPVRLREAGYQTGFVGKFGVGVQGSPRRMFDYFKPLGRNPYFKKQPDGSLRHVSQIAGDHAIAFLEQQQQARPFCLSVSFNAVHAEDGDKQNHYPWPKAVDGMYDNVQVPAPRLSDPAVFASQPEFLQKSLNRTRFFWRWDTPEKYQKNIRAYFRMISGVDHVIGRVLAALEQQGLAGNTVIIFSGDNGYYMGQRGFAGKWSHYEESLRVPLIIVDPRPSDEKRPRGAVLEPMALNVDIPATMLDLAGVPVPGVYQGASLVPLTQGKEPTAWRSDFFAEHLMHHGGIPKWEGVRGSRYVYARYFEQQPVYEFLHDLEEDPGQLRNLAADPEYTEELTKMRKRTDTLRDQYGGPYRPHGKKR